MSTQTLILMLTNVGLSAHIATRHDVQHLADFADTPQDREALRHFVREWHAMDFHLLAELAEEEFQYESVPQLARADRQALLQRKLDQAFRLTPYRRVAVQVPAKLGKQQQLILSALTARERIDPVVDLLLEEKCAIVGIHSVALASETLLRKIQLDSPHLLLVSSTTPGSLRQSYFTPEGLRFSRLASCQTEGDAVSQASTAAEEVRRTRQYLTTTRQMNREETLEALMLTDSSSNPALATGFMEQLQVDAPQIRASAETTDRLAARLGLPEQGSSWFSLLCIAIARGIIPDYYRPASAARYHWLRRVGTALLWSAGVIVVLGTAMSIQGFYEADRQQEIVAQSERNLRRQQERKREFDGKLKALAASQPAIMKESNALYRKYMADWPDVEPTAQAVSRIFADFPLLTLDRFTWRAHISADVATLAENEKMGGGLSTAKKEPSMSPAKSASGPVFDGRRWQIIELTGRMQPFEENYREALAQVDLLASRLSLLPHTKVDVVKLPLDTTPQGKIEYGNGVAANQGNFMLRVVIAPARGIKE